MTTSLDLTKLADALRDALPDGTVTTDMPPTYEVDGLRPSLVVMPASQAEVAAALGVADGLGAAVVPFGGGTQQALGMPPERYDIALDLRRLDTLVEHEPADLTVTVEAGMTLSALLQRLAERGQWLPLDPPVAETATIGGVLATNASGPARLSRGTARDLLIGITVATAQGELVKAGGRVVKNVAGYDLGKLHIGGLGTAGVIVQASFKVAPLPVRVETITASGDLNTLATLADQIIEARLAVQGLVLARDASESIWRLAARFAAGNAAVERSLRETTTLASSAGLITESMPDEAWHALQSPRPDAPLVARASVLPTDLPIIAGAFDTDASVIALPGVGVVYGAWTDDVDATALTLLRERCVAAGGAFVIEKAPVALKQQVDVWGAPRGDFALMQRLKQEMDPNRVLNPGRFVGGI